MISAIIPAFDEEGTIAAAVANVIGCPEISEVIVVDDGSSDGTEAAARKAGAKVIRLPRNRGKWFAMNAGVEAARENGILFLDADIEGMTHEKISRIIAPVLSGRCRMFVGVRSKEILFFNRYFRYFPIIGGERALMKELWQQVPAAGRSRFKIEIALNYAAKQNPPGMDFALIEGLTHSTKEQKYGFSVGFRRRLGMMYDVASIAFSLYIFDALIRPAFARFFSRGFFGSGKLDEAYGIGLLIKGIGAGFETAAGVAILFISRSSLDAGTLALFRGELAEDPKDAVAGYVMRAVQGTSLDSQHFAAAYLISSGVIKLLLLWALARGKRWAYPVSIAAFAAFIAYQAYRYGFSHSASLLFLMAFDTVVILLIAFEWRKSGKGKDSI